MLGSLQEKFCVLSKLAFIHSCTKVLYVAQLRQVNPIKSSLWHG